MSNKLKIFLAASVLINSTFANLVAKEEKTFSAKVKEKYSIVKQHLKKNKRKYAVIVGTSLVAGTALYLFSQGQTCIYCKTNHFRMNTVLLKCCKKSIGKRCFYFYELNYSKLSESTEDYNVREYSCPNKYNGCAGVFTRKVMIRK